MSPEAEVMTAFFAAIFATVGLPVSILIWRKTKPEPERPDPKDTWISAVEHDAGMIPCSWEDCPSCTEARRRGL